MLRENTRSSPSLTLCPASAHAGQCCPMAKEAFPPPRVSSLCSGGFNKGVPVPTALPAHSLEPWGPVCHGAALFPQIPSRPMPSLTWPFSTTWNNSSSARLAWGHQWSWGWSFTGSPLELLSGQTQSMDACWKHQRQGIEPCNVEVHPSSLPDMAVDNDVLLLKVTHTIDSGALWVELQEELVQWREVLGGLWSCPYSQAGVTEKPCPLRAAADGCGLGCR